MTSVPCPHCSTPICDIEDHDFGLSDTVEIQCDECGWPLVVYRRVSVDYVVEKVKGS